MNMKTKKNRVNFFLSVAICSFILASCSKELDNRSYPESRISGRFLYDGQPVQIMGTSSDVVGTNMLQLTQTGPGQFLNGYIKMFAKGDGSYTILTFDGDYQLAITPGKGPWLPTDPIDISLKGNVDEANFNVTPYFWMSDYNSSFTDSVFTASFNLEKVVPTAELEKVVIYFSPTSIVDITSKFVERSFTELTPGNVTISFDLKTLSDADKEHLGLTGFIFARVGVKTVGVADLLYSTPLALE